MKLNEIEWTEFSWDFFCLFAFLYLLPYSNLATTVDIPQLVHPLGEYQRQYTTTLLDYLFKAEFLYF